jgi:hypothetical protein
LSTHSDSGEEFFFILFFFKTLKYAYFGGFGGVGGGGFPSGESPQKSSIITKVI